MSSSDPISFVPLLSPHHPALSHTERNTHPPQCVPFKPVGCQLLLLQSGLDRNSGILVRKVCFEEGQSTFDEVARFLDSISSCTPSHGLSLPSPAGWSTLWQGEIAVLFVTNLVSLGVSLKRLDATTSQLRRCPRERAANDALVSSQSNAVMRASMSHWRVDFHAGCRLLVGPILN